MNRQERPARKILEEALGESRRSMAEVCNAGIVHRPYIFIPFNQERDSVGRLIGSRSSKSLRSKAAMDCNRESHKGVPIDYSAFKLNLLENRPRTAHKTRTVVASVSKSIIEGRQTRASQHNRETASSWKDRLETISPPRKKQTPAAVGKQTSTDKRAFTPSQFDNHLTLRSFVRTEERQRPYSTLAVRKKQVLPVEQPIADTGIVIPPKIKDDVPRILRLQSTTIHDTPELMHGRFKVLMEKMERARRSIDDINAQPIPKSMWK